MESIFPATRDRLWKVLPLHVNDGIIGKIHPGILSQRLVNKEGNTWVVDRKVRSYGRTFNLTTKIEMSPMNSYRWEIIASSGFVAPGSYVENKYDEAKEGTIVRTEATFGLRGVPRFLQGWLIRRNLSRVDEQDLQYLRSLNEG